MLLYIPYSRGGEIDPLNFGVIVVSDNSKPQTLVLSANNTSRSESLHIIQTGTPAKLLFENLPARKQVFFTDNAAATRLTNPHTGNYFTIDHLLYRGSVFTDEVGAVLLSVGAQMSTSGNNMSYNDGAYSGLIEVTLSY
jgi:hypothetical protein